MTEKQTFSAACKYLDVDEKAVLSYTVYEDHIALVVDRGGAGCPKYKIPLSELPQPEAPKAKAPARKVEK